MNVASRLQEALARENRGDLAGAAALCQKVLAREPSNIDALFLLGRAQCQLGQLETGAKAFRKIVTLRPNHAPAHTLLGMALAPLGQPQEALACFDRALAIDPRFELALAARANVLAALGRHNEAVAEYDKAIAVNAANIAVWCSRGSLLQALGRDAEAVESFERALALNPNLAEVHFNLANALYTLRQDKKAVHHYQRAVALRPDLAGVSINLASALIALERWKEAVEASERAIALVPDNALAHHNLGAALLELERYDESLVHLDKALTIDPKYSPALYRKAKLLLNLHGRADEALPLVERAIALDPYEGGYYSLLVELKRLAADDPLIAEMERLLRDTGRIDANGQASLHLALAKAYRDSGQHDASFRHLLQGNALLRQRIEYDEASTLGFFDRIRQVFTPELMRDKAGHGDPSDRPIFIVGVPRSGSTLIEQILASHPRVYGGGERTDFGNSLAPAVQAGRVDYPEVVARLTPEQLTEIGAAYIASVEPSIGDADRFTDKMPNNLRYIGLIPLVLPNARIIHARRNPIDTCLSCFSIEFNGQSYSYDLGELGRYYRAYERLMEHWRQVLPEGAMLEVQYEDVVADLEGQARRMVAYCGLEWDDACLAFHKTERPVHTASVSQVRQPIYKTSVERWRAYEKHLGPLLEALGERADAV